MQDVVADGPGQGLRSDDGVFCSEQPGMIDQRIGGHRVVRQIGEGGMGVVYEAVHEQIGRRAAIKVLHASLSKDAETVSRFLNEARAVNIVQHPGMVNIYEFGQMPDGAAFIVMEYLQGETLKTRLKRLGGRLGPDVLRITRQIASALSAAHSHSIVHRDLKPDNVMIVPDPETPGGERVKILDFGIAKLALSDDEASFKTRTGMLMGTPAYMSPEQCRGAGLVDARSDVYSLGVMLYQFLVGRLPFVAGGSGEVIGMHIFTMPPPIREIEKGVSVAMAELVHAMLAKQPAERPDMMQVVAALEKMGASRSELPVSFPPSAAVDGAGPSQPTTLGQAAAENHSAPGLVPSSKRTILFSALGAAVLGLLIIAGGGALFWRKQTPHPAVVTPVPKTVRWSVTTDPPGAQVVKQSDGQLLGNTPWERTQEAAAEPLLVVLKKPGFVDKRLSLDGSVDARIDEKLETAVQPAPATPATASPESAGSEHRRKIKGGAKKTKENKELSDDEIKLMQ